MVALVFGEAVAPRLAEIEDELGTIV